MSEACQYAGGRDLSGRDLKYGAPVKLPTRQGGPVEIAIATLN